MSGWNYRVLRRRDEHPGCGGETYLAVYEVHYDADGKPNGCGSRPTWPQGEDRAELSAAMELYQRALAEPILDYEEIARGSRESSGVEVAKGDKEP